MKRIKIVSMEISSCSDCPHVVYDKSKGWWGQCTFWLNMDESNEPQEIKDGDIPEWCGLTDAIKN